MTKAHAKINLDLRVLGTRPDGFHELRTVFQSLALHDTITCVPSGGAFTIECAHEGVPHDRSNLVWRAAETLWKAIGRRGSVRGLTVRIDKGIPVQSGLGGGSADAAATLAALARVWGAALPPGEESEVAARLGADVPFFLSGGTALGLGRGDEIYPLTDLPRLWIVLLIPAFGVSSKDAFRWYDAERRAPRRARPIDVQHIPGPWPGRAAQMVNDLEAPIARRHPEIGQMKAALRQEGAMAASMSGSGSAVFGLFEKRRDASAAVNRLRGKGWQVVLTRTLGRTEYARRGRPARPR